MFILNKKNLILLLVAVALAVVLSFLNMALPWFIFLGLLIFGVITFFVFKNPVIGIFLIAFFLPFERLGAYEFGGTTIRISQILFVITIFAWVLGMIFRRKYKFAKNPLIISLVLFLLINLLSITNSINQERSLTIFLFILFTSFMAIVMPSLIRNKESVDKVVIILLVSCFLVSIFGAFQFLGDMGGLPTTLTGLRDLYTKNVLGFTRVQSTAYEPLYFANYLLIPLSIIYALYLSRAHKIKTLWLIFLLMLGLVNLVLTVSRGGYLAIIATFFIASIFYLKKFFSFRNLIIVIIIVALVGWVVIRSLGGLNLENFTEHVSNAFYGASYNERIETFENAKIAWLEHPLLGVGIGGFGPYVAPHPYYIPKDGWRIVNNEFIEILAETGILGLASFFLIILIIIVRSIKAIIKSEDKFLKAVIVGLLAAFIGVLVQYLTFSTLYIMHVWFLIGLIIVVQNIILNKYVEKSATMDSRSQD